jgi:hypothetical protein
MPPLMPVVGEMTFETGRVPDWQEAAALVAASPVCRASRGEVNGRVFWAWTAWLRELHLGLALSELWAVSKDWVRDLRQGCDWIVRNGIGQEATVSLAHEGAASRSFWNARKEAKLAEGTVVLTASGEGEGLHTVPRSQAITAVAGAFQAN